MSKSTSERRKYLRLDVRIDLRIITEDGRVVSSMIKNLSPLGIGLESETKMKDGEIMDLSLYLPETKNPVHIQGKVVWHRPIPEKKDPVSYDIGCEFMKIEEDNKNTFLKFFCDLIYGNSVSAQEKEKPVEIA